MTQKFSLSVMLICLGLIMVGCTGAAIQVQTAQAIVGESELSKKSVEIYNCDLQVDLHRSLAEEAQVICTTAISDIAVSTGTGEALQLPEEMKASLIAEIESTYQKNVDEAKQRVAEIDLLVPVGKIRTYDIFWRQETYSSTVAFKFNGDAYSVAYTYTVNIPDAVMNNEISCTG